MRTLIDAVEEHSEQNIREDTVSNLVEVNRFFLPLLRHNSDDSLKLFCDLIVSIPTLDIKVGDAQIMFIYFISDKHKRRTCTRVKAHLC